MSNLIQHLTKEDRETLTAYINTFGVEKQYFIGVDNWLKNWDKNKTKLYKLLGNQFVYKIPCKVEKNEEVLKREVAVLQGSDEFINRFRQYLWKENDKYFYNENNYQANLKDEDDRFTIFYRFAINLLDSTYYCMTNKIDISLEFKNHYYNSKMIKIQSNTKYIKALSRLLDYISESETFKEFEKNYDTPMRDLFEKFRIKHSMVLNDKVLKGNLCISIHPMDFITMSDNNSKWSSCMSWKEEGCYRVGTIEMMNSNNVVCCYLESTEPYIFNDNYTWNNKKWRQLCYVTKDIIVSAV